MESPLGVMSVILLEAAAGSAVVLWASKVWSEVRRGFVLLTGITIAFCAVSAWLVVRGELAAVGTPAGDRALAAMAAFAALTVVWQLVLLIRQSAVSRIIGLLSAVLGVAALVLVGLARPFDPAVAVAELVTGALFLGSTVYGLLLGHWYLVERRLDKRHMITSASWYLAGVAAGLVAAVLSARNPAPALEGFSPFLSVPGFSVLLAVGLVAVCALIAGFVWKLAREGGRSIQAATGMFYLAVIMAFSAEMSAKFRFF